MREQIRLEKKKKSTLDELAAPTGKMLAAIFNMKRDCYGSNLEQMGFFLGKFIYIMDAYDDLYKDIKKHNFNPLIKLKDSPDFSEKCRNVMTIMAAESARAFERLPVIDADIIRNIIYSGIWTRFTAVTEERKQKKEDMK